MSMIHLQAEVAHGLDSIFLEMDSEGPSQGIEELTSGTEVSLPSSNHIAIYLWTGLLKFFSLMAGGFQFLEDDDEYDVETIFSSAFGGSRSFFYSFINDEPEWQNSSRHSNNYRFYWNQRNQYDEEYGSSNDSDSSVTDVRSDRLALGLSASGPLSLEDVKNA